MATCTQRERPLSSHKPQGEAAEEMALLALGLRLPVSLSVAEASHLRGFPHLCRPCSLSELFTVTSQAPGLHGYHARCVQPALCQSHLPSLAPITGAPQLYVTLYLELFSLLCLALHRTLRSFFTLHLPLPALALNVRISLFCSLLSVECLE